MKTYLSGSDPSIRVPIREIALTNGERLRLYGLEIEVREASDGRIRSVRIAPGDAQYSREAR